MAGAAIDVPVSPMVLQVVFERADTVLQPGA
jgi:hypothetical protein